MTEHQLIERECGCGHRTKGAAPPGAEAPVQYGPRIAAIIVYLYIGQFLSKERTAQALAELFGVPLSAGTVAAMTARAAGRLDGFLEQAREQIAASEVAGFDETGFRVAGRLHWVHCARTGKYTLLMVHPRRGTEGDEGDGHPCARSPGSPSMTPGPRMTPTPALITSCATRTRCGNCRPSPTAAPAGQWCWAAQAADALTAMQAPGREAIARAVTPRTRPRWPRRSAWSAPLPCRGPPDRRPLRHADEKTPCPGPPPARPPGRLPAVHSGLAGSA